MTNHANDDEQPPPPPPPHTSKAIVAPSLPYRGFASICLHSGYVPDGTTSCGVPLYRTAPYVFKSTDHAQSLFALQEPGYLYTRIGNP